MEPTFTVQINLISSRETFGQGNSLGAVPLRCASGILRNTSENGYRFAFGYDFILGPGRAGEGKVALLEGFGLVGVADIQDELFFAKMELAGGI